MRISISSQRECIFQPYEASLFFLYDLSDMSFRITYYPKSKEFFRCKVSVCEADFQPHTNLPINIPNMRGKCVHW